MERSLQMGKVSNKLWDNIGILITSHPKQHLFMEPAGFSWRDCPHYILLGYDDVDTKTLPLNLLPHVKETFVSGEPAGKLGHFRGELELIKKGAKILQDKGYKYIYKTAADNAAYRWYNLPRMIQLLEGRPPYDLVILGTTQILAKLDVLNKLMDLWHPKLKCGGAELYLYSQIRAFQSKVLYKKADWWTDTIGLIHLQGEYAIGQDISIYSTWRIGQLYGEDYKHRDLVPGR